ncbi:MAG: sulfurtransferase TusA family protein [Myxococcales bacterium]|nr:sulfurtransferase TusA family protein [Myxococcales bacterium]
MKAHSVPVTLSKWLGLPQVTQEEVAVVQHGAALSSKALQSLLPASTVLLDLSALQRDHWISLRRLELAHALVVITDRQIQETEAALVSFRKPDYILRIQDFPSQEDLRVELEGAISHFCGLVLNSQPTSDSVEELDYMGLKCPMPIVRLSAHVRKYNPTDIQILADDRAFPADLKAWAERSDADIKWLSGTEQPPFRAKLSFQVKKQAIPHIPSSSFVIQLPPELLQEAAQQQTPSSSFEVDALSGSYTMPISGSHSLSALSSASLVPLSPNQPLSSSPNSLPILEELDYNDKRSPLHLVALQKDIKRFHEPGILVIHTKDPQFLQDLRHWCEQKDARILKTSQQGGQVTAWISIHDNKSGTIDKIELTTSDHIATFGGRETIKQQSLNINPRSTHMSNNVLPQVTPIESLLDLPPGFVEPHHASNIPAAPPQQALTALPDKQESEPIALNFCGLKCPMPIVQLSKQVREHPKDTLKVSADDPAFPVDLKAWCDIHGYSVQKEQQSGNVYHAWLFKA